MSFFSLNWATTTRQLWCVVELKMTSIHRVIQNDGLNWRVNGASTHARQLVTVFPVLCSLNGLTCVGYPQNSLEFFSFCPLIHAKYSVLHSGHFALKWRCCISVNYASDLAVRFENVGSPLLKCYVVHSYTINSSGNIHGQKWVNIFESCSTWFIIWVMLNCVDLVWARHYTVINPCCWGGTYCTLNIYLIRVKGLLRYCFSQMCVCVCVCPNFNCTHTWTMYLFTLSKRILLT